jgi:hypothetical protein
MAMIALLKYGTGMPLYRISKLQASLGIRWRRPRNGM